jgi:DNA-binding Xre family transcriptional regulator
MKKSLYWLANEMNSDMMTLWKLASNQRIAIYFDTLEKLYKNLECRKSELIEIVPSDFGQSGV